ncbi:unnamed protein product, partial [Musa hybrid cultivar]
LKRHQLVIEDGDFLLNIRLAVMEEDTPFSTEKERGTERERERVTWRGWSSPPKAPKEPHSRMLVSSLCVTHTCMCVGTWEQHMLSLRLLFIPNLYID